MSVSRKTNRDHAKKTNRPMVEDEVIASQLVTLRLIEVRSGKIWHSYLTGLRQISSPNKAQSGFVSEEYVPILIEPLHKTERHRCPKRL